LTLTSLFYTLSLHDALPICWFVLIVPVILFITLITYLPQINQGESFTETLNWIPTFNINLTSYIDGLSLIFGLLITGIGALVVRSEEHTSELQSRFDIVCRL